MHPSWKQLKWLDKSAMVHPQDKILLSNTMQQADDSSNIMDESQMHSAQWKKPLQSLSTVWFHVCHILEKLQW